MFNIIKKTTPAIPTRLPEEIDSGIAEGEVVAGPAESVVRDSQDVTEDDRNSENTETPPLTPPSDIGGDGSSDEETTIEEVRTAHTLTQQMPVVSAVGAVTHRASVERTVERTDPNRECEFSSDENPDGEEGSENGEDRKKSPKQMKFKLLSVWLLFWAVALAGGVLAYYLNVHEIPSQNLDAEPTTVNNLLLVPREKWDDSTNVVAKPLSYMAQRVVVLQTDTEPCDTITTCSRLLNAMKRREGMMNYNFLLSTDGFIYEALGWQELSPLYPGTRSMVVALIGNYATASPSMMQLTQLEALLDVSTELKYLVECYTIIGRKQTIQPSKLFSYLAKFKNWDKENSDTDEQYLEIDLEPSPIFDD